MSTARKVLMIIALVASILVALLLAFLSIVLFISLGNEELLERLLDGLNKSSTNGRIYVTCLGTISGFFTIIEIINICLCAKAIKSNNGGLMIANIIFGFIAGIYVNCLGGLFGILEGKKS